MGELLVLANVRRDDPANLLVLKKPPEPDSVCSTVVGDDLQVGGPEFDQSVDKGRRNTADPETTRSDDCAPGDIGNGLSSRQNDLVHPCPALHF